MEHESTKPIKTLLSIYGLFVVVSFLFCIYTGYYNGDYLSVPVKLPLHSLLLNLFTSLLPFYLLWRFYLYSKAKKCRTVIKISHKAIYLSFWLLLAWSYFITLKWGVGRMMMDVYQAPAIVTPIIQITNRIKINMLAALCVFCCTKNLKGTIAVVVPVAVLGILRNSLSFCSFALLIFFVRHYVLIISYIKRHLFLFLSFLFLIPTIVASLYSFRDQLRGGTIIGEMSVIELLVGKLVGRLSSYSNLSVITQDVTHFSNSVKQLDYWYYAQQMFSALGSYFEPINTPEKIMVHYVDYLSSVTFMAGLPGNFVLSWMKHPLVFLFNILMFLFVVFILFRLGKKVKGKNMNELVVIMLVGPFISGVPAELFSLVISYLLMYFYIIVINSLFFRKHAS